MVLINKSFFFISFHLLFYLLYLWWTAKSIFYFTTEMEILMRTCSALNLIKYPTLFMIWHTQQVQPFYFHKKSMFLRQNQPANPEEHMCCQKFFHHGTIPFHWNQIFLLWSGILTDKLYPLNVYYVPFTRGWNRVIHDNAIFPNHKHQQFRLFIKFLRQSHVTVTTTSAWISIRKIQDWLKPTECLLILLIAH